MKRSLFVVAALLISWVAMAQDSTQVQFRVGFVDPAAILSEMPEIKALNQKVDEQRVVYEKEYETMQTDYNQKVKSYIANNKQMSEPIKLARQAEITEYEKRIVLYRQRYQKELQQMLTDGEAASKQKIADAIVVAANNAKVNIVFDQATPLYADSSCVDLTPAVRAILGLK